MAYYRIEAHDGNRWRFGIRYDNNKRIPVYCGIASADHFITREAAENLLEQASRLCGGTLRIATIKA